MKDKANIYIETSVVSYLSARPSSNLTAAAWQQITYEWWKNYRHYYDLYISELVITEAGRGDPAAAKKRLSYLVNLSQIITTDEARVLANTILSQKVLPEKAAADAFHIAIAAYHDIDYLLTWNCTHINNAQTKPVIRSICAEEGYGCPEICTPQELMGDI
ncbi:Type II toxin-antitoxin system VapC family toxin [Candidatus Magnetomoraceae bacterium gMMP-15]